MITEKQQQTTKRAFREAKAHGWEVVVFWQDHFYTRNGKFGYPVCIQLQNIAENHVEDCYIVHWSSFKNVCANTVESIDAYLAELEAQQTQPVEATHANE